MLYSCALLLAAAPLWAGPLTGPGEPPVWVAELGLKKENGIWTVTRTHPRRGVTAARPLTPAEVLVVDEQLAKLPEQGRDDALAQGPVDYLQKRNVPLTDTYWFRPGAERAELTPCGREAAVGLWLGDPHSSGVEYPRETPFERPIRLSLAPRLPAIEAETPAAGAAIFDGAPGLAETAPPVALPEKPAARPLPPLTLQAGSYPASLPLARNLESVYHAYGWGADRLINAATGAPGGAGAIALRFLKMPVDLALAGAGSWIEHETGHMGPALAAGAKRVGFSKAKTFTITGLVVKITADPGRITPAEDLDVEAGGINATQAAARDARGRFLSQDKIPWTYLPLYVAHHTDASDYLLLFFPKPKGSQPDNSGFDTSDYRDGYAVLSGRSRKKIHKDMVVGGLLNAADPLSLWALYSYAVEYLIKGNERVNSPMLSVGPVEAMAGTGFWMSRNGPWYYGDLYLRVPEKNLMVQLSPSFGDRGQWTGEAQASWSPRAGTRVCAFGAVWEQCGGPTGDKSLGGGGGVALEQELWKGFGIEARGGYKSEGAWLGRQFSEGAFGEGGLRYGY